MDDFTKKNHLNSQFRLRFCQAILGSPLRLHFNRCPNWRMVVYGALLVIAVLPLLSCAEAQDAELCVVEYPLKSPYFIPYVSKTSPCSGCYIDESHHTNTSVELSRGSTVNEVHVVQVENRQETSIEISLKKSIIDPQNFLKSRSQETPKNVLALVVSPLHTDASPLTVSLIGYLQHVNVLLLIRSIDHADLSGLQTGVQVETRALNDTGKNLDQARKLFGFLSSLTRTGDANRIILDLNKSVSSQTCANLDSGTNPLVECFKLVKKQNAGCYHQNMIGVNEKDIHIIQVEQGREKRSSTIELQLKGSTMQFGTSSSPSQRDSVSPSVTSAVRRNITLVLRADIPTLWRFSALRLQGFVTLLVGPEDQVENKSSSGGGVSLTVKRFELPKTFDQMFIKVLTSIGLPVSYTNTESPDLITVVVPSKAENIENRITKAYNAESLFENVHSLVVENTVKECGRGFARVSLPNWVAQRVGGVSMNFQNPSCRGTMNGTHLILSSRFTDCGFTRRFSDFDTVYTNFAQIKVGTDLRIKTDAISDDEDFKGEGSGYDADDVYKESIPTIVVKCIDKYDSPKEYFNSMKKDSVGYDLTLFQDADFSLLHSKFPILLSSKPFLVYAKLSFGTRTGDSANHIEAFGLNILVEKCWLSPSETGREFPLILIEKSCPVQEKVVMITRIPGPDFRFSFQFPQHYIAKKKLFLHCEVGMCSDRSLPQPSYKKCVDPASYCNKISLMDIFSKLVVASHVDHISAGPLVYELSDEDIFAIMNFNSDQMTSKLNEHHVPSSKIGAKNDRNGVENGAKTGRVVVMEGLSTEIVIGIALASFVIGVAMSATIWIIYIKTDLRRQKPKESDMGKGFGYDLSTHSGSSTPSSQAPMTA